MKRLRDRGAILVISFWVLTLLSLLAVGLAYRMALELRLADYDVGRLQLFYLAQGGLHRASSILQQDDLETDSLQDAWAAPTDPGEPISLGEGSFLLTLSDEYARPNLNQVDQEILMRVPEMTESVALSLRNWRGDQDLPPSLLDEEEAHYRSLPRPIERKLGPFQSLEEVAMVRKMTPSLHASVQSLFTVYGGGKVNLNTASEATFVLLGLEEELTRELVRFRLGEDGEPGTEDDRIFHTVSDLTGEDIGKTLDLSTDQQLALVNFVTQNQQMLTVQSNHFRVRCRATSKNKMTKEVIAVLQRTSEGPPVIKYWHED